MMCCASKPLRKRTAAAADGRLPARAAAGTTPPRAAGAAAAGAAAAGGSLAAASSASTAAAGADERQRQILVRFPGEPGDREVRWAEDRARPSTMDEVRELLRHASNGSLGGPDGGGGFDVLDEDGDALLAPSTWPPDTQVIVTRRE